MSRTVNVNEEFVVVSEGKKDTGKFAALGNDGKFDTSVIPVIDELQEQITKEVTERTEGDKALQTNIDTEASARISADQQLQRNIEADASARDAADKDLQDQISKEITARTDGDTALQSNVDKEEAARTDADSKLQSSIDNEVDARTKADQSLQDQLTAEIAARTNADETEANTRVSADKELQNKIDALEGKNAFSNVVVNGTTIKAASQEDTIELEAGTNIALTADTDSDKVTIAVTGKVASAAQADSATTAESCTGNAATATKLETVRNINGVSFDGSADITIIAKANGGNTDTVGGYSVDQLIAKAGNIVEQSLEKNGYVKFSNGLILQWGRFETNNNWNTKISFPAEFSTMCAAINITLYNPSGTATSGTWRDSVGIKCFDTSGFYGGGSVIGYTCFFTAIGF